ncbi:hypothetical protein HK099_008579 [Clydaea vesicula]|uniref:FAM192A/Fyv6 N-terminal domain-containing protein n=1 Tax=Clydaea vesicula TaxID=447962 RepID=A0AAD5U915_9FUNG|nr:hypothetical protein HK099_008579 [Clydaea vesicula]KAJ3390204.1 hypothetical protein HDU92_000612 [Lobulomyces angularis]
MNRFVSTSVLKEGELEERKVNAPVLRETGNGNDQRSLFEKLQSQKLAKEEEFQESIKFSKRIKRLDDDEIEFLNQQNEINRNLEFAKKKEVDKELENFRKEKLMNEEGNMLHHAAKINPRIQEKKEVLLSNKKDFIVRKRKSGEDQPAKGKLLLKNENGNSIKKSRVDDEKKHTNLEVKIALCDYSSSDSDDGEV